MGIMQNFAPLALLLLATPVAAIPPVSLIVPILWAHGILATLSWALFFPLGTVLVRVVTKDARRIHTVWQTGTVVIFTVAWALGVWLATELHLWTFWNGHAIIGTIVFGLMWTMPILGLLHHYQYIGGSRAYTFAWIHVWLGRLLITVGTINGGLGLQVSYHSVPKISTRHGEIAYGVVAGVVWLIWVSISILAVVRSHGDVNVGSESGPKIQGVESRKDSEATAIGGGGAAFDKEKGSEEEARMNGHDAGNVTATTSDVEKSAAAVTTTGATGAATTNKTAAELDGVTGGETTHYTTTTYTTTTSGGEDIVHGGEHYNTRLANVIDPSVQAPSNSDMFA